VFNNCKSDYFACDNGVRQGENLYAFSFSLFSNDLETFLQAKNVTDLESISSELENQLRQYQKPS
jgi:urease accessory protein UreF